MSEKYKSVIGRYHLAKENLREKWSDVKENGGFQAKANEVKEEVIKKINHGDEEYDHLYRRKSRWELVRISSAVMGIEFSYAAETAFVSPTLLKIGVLHKHMTLIWCLSPLVGFFCTPILGSLSDRCRSNLGRRRPFIILLSIGVVLGLILVPNGKLLGKQLGDRYPLEEAWELQKGGLTNVSMVPPKKIKLLQEEDEEGPGGRLSSWNKENNDDYSDGESESNEGEEESDEEQESEDDPKNDVEDENNIKDEVDSERDKRDDLNISEGRIKRQATKKKNLKALRSGSGGLPKTSSYNQHPWGIFFTILGTVLLDFDADACQSPSRAYLLDVTVPADHAVGLSTFTIMAGLGGSLGYAMGGIDWGIFGDLFGGHVRLVFTLVLFIFIICVHITLTSFPEIPLDILANSSPEFVGRRRSSCHYNQLPSQDLRNEELQKLEMATNEYKSMEQKSNTSNPFTKDSQNFNNGAQMEGDKKYLPVAETSFSQASPMAVEEGEEAKRSMATLTEYLWSIIYMPSSLRILCLTNLFCWMSLVCYSLYFTDYVGEAVFGGNPAADPGTKARRLYDEGVRFGCWGMAMYSLSCSCYSFIIEKLVKRFRARPVYVCGQLVYCVGMIFMALSRSKWGVLLFSWSAGVMYSTLFTMPYLLVAHYHETDRIQCEDVWLLRQLRLYWSNKHSDPNDQAKAVKEMADRKRAIESQVRGIGTDVGIVSSMVFLAQFILSLSMGSIINHVQSTTAVVVAASVLSFCGAVSANFVEYLDL